jgi:AcrR family transcriptional regulator
MMTTKENRKKETVQRILDASAKIFAEAGFEGARVDEIAKRARVNKAMIYYHIGDKKALYTRVLLEIFGDAASRMADNIDNADTPLEKLRAYLRSIGETLLKHPHLPPIMMREMADGGRNLPEVVAKELASIIGMVHAVLNDGHREGIFVEVEPLVLHLMVVGGISYFKTSGPARHKYFEIIGDSAGTIKDPDGLDFKSEIENIILRAVLKR